MPGTRRRHKPSWYRDRRTVVAGLLLFGLGFFVVTRSEPPPRQPGDICSIFREKRSWYDGARRSHETWGVPEAVQMAIIFQESSFRARARPPIKWLWGFIPWGRVSSAYGYAQAIDGTWASFEESVGYKASRRNFSDVTEFVGWYGDHIHRVTGIAKTDAYNLYLAYHEGPAGFRRGSHLKKQWLLGVAAKVQKRAERYQGQYDACADSLKWRWEVLIWMAVVVLLVLALRAWFRRRGHGKRQRP